MVFAADPGLHRLHAVVLGRGAGGDATRQVADPVGKRRGQLRVDGLAHGSVRADAARRSVRASVTGTSETTEYTMPSSRRIGERTEP